MHAKLSNEILSKMRKSINHLLSNDIILLHPLLAKSSFHSHSKSDTRLRLEFGKRFPA